VTDEALGVYHVVLEVDGTRMTRCPYTTVRERAVHGELAGFIPLNRSRSRCPRCETRLMEPAS
jgi:hypothetical protein